MIHNSRRSHFGYVMLAQHSTARHGTGYSLYPKKRVNAELKMGGKTELDRVVAYIPPELKKELEEWAETDERSVSWVVAKLIEKALHDRRQRQNPSNAVNAG